MVMMVITPTIFTVWVMLWLLGSQNTLVFLAYLQGDWHPTIALSCCKIAIRGGNDSTDVQRHGLKSSLGC